MDHPPAGSRLRTILLGLALLAGLNFLAYWPSFRAPFVFDDRISIFMDPKLMQAKPGQVSLWSVARPSLQTRRPLASFSFALNQRFLGSEPWSFHAVNWAIHLLNAGLVFGLIWAVSRRGFSRAGEGLGAGPAWGSALAGALLWSLHPVQTQAVTYIVQRMTALATFFYLLALLLWLQARAQPGRAAQAGLVLAALGCAGLGFFAKETLFTWPLCVVLLELLVLGQGRPLHERRGALVKAAAVIGCYGALVSALVLLARWGWDPTGNVAQFSAEWKARLLSQPGELWHYLSLLMFPHLSRLSLDPEWSLAQGLFRPWTTVPSWLGLLGLVGISLRGFRSRPLPALALFFFLLTLLPESIVPYDPVFDHRLYLPSVGLLGGLGAVWVGPGRLWRTRLLLFGAAVVFCAILTSARNTTWTDEERLWRDTVRKSPGKSRAWNNLAVMDNAQARVGSALHALQAAVRLDPKDFLAWINLSEFALERRNIPEARRAAQRAMALDPNNGLALLALAKADTAAGNRDQALDWYNLILQQPAGDAGFLEKVGEALIQFHRPDLALIPYRQAGERLLRAGRKEEAIRVLDQALKLLPGDPELKQMREQARARP